MEHVTHPHQTPSPESESIDIDNGQIQKDIELKSEKQFSSVILAVYVALIGLGVLTGFLLSKTPGKFLALPFQKIQTNNSDKVAGASDERTFKDSAQGVLEKGGIDGEGTHKLIREGGPSQTAYLMSSFVDLDQYEGKKVKVWGETFAAKKASWLMDVGKVEIQ